MPFAPPGYLPDPGIKPRSPTLQADALPSEPPGIYNFQTLFEFIGEYITPLLTLASVFLPPSNVYVRSFLCLLYTLIKLSHTVYLGAGTFHQNEMEWFQTLEKKQDKKTNSRGPPWWSRG